jgi:hypothetical protein
MKTVEARNATATVMRETKPFFSKKREQHFFGSSKTETPFFPGSETRSPIQPKLEVGHPDDAYEREADCVADRVVNRLPELKSNHSQPINDKSIIQNKSEITEEKPKELKEEEDPVPEVRKLRRKPIFESNAESPEDEISVQKKPDNSGTQTAADHSVENNLNSTKGSGRQLSEQTRHEMGSSIGSDFSRVRIHDDSNAAQLSKDLNAQAFTHGNDIYFNSGKYDPETVEGKHLLAHELTHTVQQSGGKYAQLNTIIQKQTGSGKPDFKKATKKELKDAGDSKIGFVEKVGSRYRFHIPILKTEKYHLTDADTKVLESVKMPHEMPKYERDTDQETIWNQKVRKDVKDNLEEVAGPKPVDKSIYYKLKLENKDAGAKGIVGTFTQLSNEVLVPMWDKDGKPKVYQIEHMVDFQIIGDEADDITNLILLESKANNAAGKQVKKIINQSLNDIVHLYKSQFSNVPEVKQIRDKSKQEYLMFTDKFDGSSTKQLDEADRFRPREFTQKNNSKNPFKKTFISIVDEKIPANHILLTTRDDRASYIIPKYKKRTKVGAFYLTVRVKGQDVDTILFETDQKEEIAVAGKKVDLEKTDVQVEKGTAEKYTIKDDTKSIISPKLKSLMLPRFSPIEIQDKDIITEGLDVKASGKVKSTLSILENVDISFAYYNGNFNVKAVIPLDQISKNVPKPFKVDNCNIEIGGGTNDPLYIAGGLGFSIEKLGDGDIYAKLTSKGLNLDGQFNFDSKYFNPALVRVAYEDGKWEIGGELGIKQGIVKGIKKGSLKAAYKESLFSIDGEAELTVPGIDKVRMHAEFTETGDFTFTADVELKKVTGIKSGKAKVTITSKGEEGLKLGIGGEAELDFPVIPNLNPKLTISYIDGIYEIRTKVTYKKGRFEGTIEVGVTNKQVDEKGQPQGEPQEKGDVLVFGFGELKVDIYKDIKGSVSVRLTPERNVLIGGKIEAKELKPFGDGFKYDKEILPFPTIEIPLVGIPGMSVSAFVGGGVHFKFSWDPLVLKEILIDFKETNINELEKASLEISGSVGSSAHAEVYLSIEAGLKARVLIATLSGSLGGEAGLGLDAEAGGKVDAGWDMEKGLRFKEIRAYLDVTPKAIFRLTGKVSVDLDLWVTTINLYEHKWVLAEKSLDLSGITLKLDFPIKFNENGNVELPSYESMNVVKPDFNGDSGKAILDDAINGDAKKEEAAKKEKIRAQIRTDLRSADNKDVTPTEYTKKMMDKYEKSPELQEFVKNTIEEECRKLEYEHFEENKNFIRNQESPLSVKLNTLNMFTIFYGYVTPADIETFRAELTRLEEEKKMKEAAAAAAATQSTDNKKVNGTPGPPDQPPADKNGSPVMKKGMIQEGVPLRMKSAFDSEDEEYNADNARRMGEDPGEEFEQKLNQSGGKGQSIPEEESRQLEELMGADFSGVRIHNDQEAHELNKQISSQAFTRGNDVYFNSGKYNPSTVEGQRLLAHELAHVIQQEGDRLTIRVQLHAVAATPRARKTHDDVFGKGPATGMSLRDFKTYTGQQADWFVEPTLTTPDRNDLWKLLLKTRPDSPVLAGVGDLTVTELRGVTDVQWIDLNVYCNGCDSSKHTVRIVPSGSLTDRITLGLTLKSLETAIPPIVLEHTVTEIQLKRIQSEALLVPLMAYFKLFQPHLQETVGSAAGLTGGVKSETELLLDFIKAPGMLPFGSLLGTVRNLHRFAPDALTQLMSNYADFSHKKPVYLVLYSGHDYNSAFLRSKSLFENLLKDKSRLVLMLEGQGSIQDIIDKVPKIAKDYGKPDKGKVNRIAQVMIAGHGSSRSIELAGTGAPKINAQGEVEYSVESLDLDKNAAKSVKLLEVLMDNMDPAAARLVYAGCLVGSREVPVKDATGKALTAADISREENDPAKKSLAAFTRDMAAARGKGGMPVEGGRASVALADSRSLLDAAGNLHVDYTFDPTSFGTANVYAASGREPEGVMRAAVELAAVDPIVAANQLRIRQGIAAKDTWYDPVTLIFVKAALDGVPPAGGIDIVKVNQLSHMAPHFLLSYWASRSIAHFGADVNVIPALASVLYADVLALPAMSAPGDIKVKQGRFILELSWCMMNPARSANVITYLDARADLTAEILEQHLDIAWLDSVKSGSALFPAAAAVSDGRIRLAIAWLNKDNKNADVRAFLNSQVDDTGSRPRLKPQVLAQLSNPADEDNILLILGRLAPTVPPKGAGQPLPAANADVFPNGKGPAMNDIRIEPNVYTATVVPPAFVLNVRILPSMAGKAFHWLKRGEKVNVMGFVHNWAAVDINGRLGFAHKNFLSAPPV